MTIARYSFLPWLRRGVANQLQVPASSASRASLTVSLTVSSDVESQPLTPKNVELVGPGDVIGFNPQQVVRTEPRNWIADFEPNYLAFVEFYEEDFPWRYTPASPDTAAHRLPPWITLLLLKETEFTRDNSPGKPLPSISLTPAANAAALFAPAEQLWAWAHVHVNDALGPGHAPDLDGLDARLRANPDVGYSRLICPRRLEPNTGYTAVVIPTFEVGRKAGLAEAVADTDSGLAISWATATEFPVYYEWYFRTGAAGDFEELVRALKPRSMPKEVGIRDMDIQRPEFGMPPIQSSPDDSVGLEGALLSPFTASKPLDPASNFPPEIQSQVNLASDALSAGVGAQDPVVTAPLYGRWHALVDRINADPAQSNWVNELNSDPRFRAPAGMATRVIQEGQEEYMKLAWQQIGEILAANRKVAYVQMAVKASQAAYEKHLAPLPEERALPILAPVFRKVMGSPVTIQAQVSESLLTASALGGAMRKQLRPRGVLARRALPATGRAAGAAAMLRPMNEGLISAAPPRPLPEGATLERVIEELEPRHSGHAWAFAPERLTVRAITEVPRRASFRMAPPGEDPPEGPPPVGTHPTDERDFRRALQDFHTLTSERVPPAPPRPAAALDSMHASVMRAVEPVRAFPIRLGPLLRVGGKSLVVYTGGYGDAPQGADPSAPRIVPAMAYPDIKRPMYEPLRDISSDFFVPNLKQIPPNTISLMVQNQPFIEAYMVGVNHEFARELLWREYPTDQRGSTFRQFWDTSGCVDTQGLPPAQLAEKLRDITRIHEWAPDSKLGDHNNRDPEGHLAGHEADPEDRTVVLVIRGDLLKRYPNTIIYAQRARWGEEPDTLLQLLLWDETGEKSEADPADPNLRFPIYKAKVGPDIHFTGFDLTLREVRGDPNLAETAEAKANIPGNRLGWFFVIKEVVGEPRFGLDEEAAAEPSEEKWDNLAWDSLGADVKVIDVAAPLAADPPGTNPSGAAWGANSADMAFILYQKPVLVAVHARDLLKGL
ncbi:MAG TPA: hypothetical protein VGQ32_04040 [Thermoanaerobaculia bacterium]|nr:hypothetical protein [Thermoanaerobaculia bacterium]